MELGGLDHSRGAVGSGFAGMAQGLFRTVCSLAGLILGMALAVWNYALVAAVIQPVVRIEAVADAIGFLLIAVVVMASPTWPESCWKTV